MARDYTRSVRAESGGKYLHYSTDCWELFEGHNHYSERGFTGATYVTLNSSGTSTRTVRTVNFQMFYVNSEKGTPDSFAGAWQAKWGESLIWLVFQQAGDQVTGQLNINSVIYAVKEGRADAKTLRFKIVRPGRALPNAYLPDEVLGTGELVIDEGGKSFTGKILNADVSGTLIGR